MQVSRYCGNRFRVRRVKSLAYIGYSRGHSTAAFIESTKTVKFKSEEEFVRLFVADINETMSLFRGRDDVYAKRWQNKEGKSGYSPVCLNEWVKGICSKPIIKCSDCANRNYAILDSNAIDSHLRGKAVFGIYPMLPDETRYFLTMDFDDDGWQKDVRVLRDICTIFSIDYIALKQYNIIKILL